LFLLFWIGPLAKGDGEAVQKLRAEIGTIAACPQMRNVIGSAHREAQPGVWAARPSDRGGSPGAHKFLHKPIAFGRTTNPWCAGRNADASMAANLLSF
jgi:hypothetical protein